ncbi:MAG TPA: hypothetical protein VHV75_12040 [Solirubrobacteraceae bacterium]|nr:hypothetical protein [Solirubrobacteraceae bacterium]
MNTAVRRTLAVTWLRYEISLERPSLFKAPLSVQGGRAAYDVKTGLGYAFLQLKLPSGGYQILFCDLEPTTFLLSPSPAPAGVLPAGKSWISAPLSTPTADHTLAAQAEGLAPALFLDEVAWGARRASSLGTQVVEAVPMDEYRVSVDLATALSAARRARRGSIAAAIEQELHASPSGRVSIIVWVSGPGYIGKIKSEVPGSGLGTASFFFSSFTRPYTGTPPPASQIVPLASLERPGQSLWGIATSS